jgi:hypothetical protein
VGRLASDVQAISVVEAPVGLAGPGIVPRQDLVAQGDEHRLASDRHQRGRLITDHIFRPGLPHHLPAGDVEGGDPRALRAADLKHDRVLDERWGAGETVEGLSRPVGPGQVRVPDLPAGLEIETVEMAGGVQHEDPAPIDQGRRDRPILRSPAPGITISQSKTPELPSAAGVKGPGEVRVRVREEIDRHSIHHGHAGVTRSDLVLPGHGQGNGARFREDPASVAGGVAVRSPEARPVLGPQPRLRGGRTDDHEQPGQQQCAFQGRSPLRISCGQGRGEDTRRQGYRGKWLRKSLRMRELRWCAPTESNRQPTDS